MTVEGIDVSKHQGRIDWEKVAQSGRQFAFIKASEGFGYTDPRFVENWNAARQADLLVGAYHFARVSESIELDARREADWFADVMTGVGALDGGRLAAGVLPGVLDIEWDQRAEGIKAPKILQWCKTFLARLEERTQRVPVVYCGPSFWKYKLAKTDDLVRYPLWEVNYTTRPQPKPMGSWKWTFWQHSAEGSVPGIEGNVDVNRFAGSENALRVLAGFDTPRGAIESAPESWIARNPPPAGLGLPRLDLAAAELPDDAVARLHALLMSHFEEVDGLVDEEGRPQPIVSSQTREMVATLKQRYGLSEPDVVDTATWWILVSAGLASA